MTVARTRVPHFCPKCGEHSAATHYCFRCLAPTGPACWCRAGVPVRRCEADSAAKGSEDVYRATQAEQMSFGTP